MTQLHDSVLEVVPNLRRYALLTSDAPAEAHDDILIALDHVTRERSALDRARINIFATYQAVSSSLELMRGERPAERLRHAKSDRVAEAVLGLPRSERQALVLMSMENFTDEEAAYILDCPPSDVAQRHHVARETVKSALKPEFTVFELD
jgi:DNA-directed RNA polymerase specialized sigma24 family protein